MTDPEPLPAQHERSRHFPERSTVTTHVDRAKIGTRDGIVLVAAEPVLAGLAGEPLSDSAPDDRAGG